VDGCPRTNSSLHTRECSRYAGLNGQVNTRGMSRHADPVRLVTAFTKGAAERRLPSHRAASNVRPAGRAHQVQSTCTALAGMIADDNGCHSLIAIRTVDSLPQVFKMLDDMLDEAGFTFIMGTCNEG